MAEAQDILLTPSDLHRFYTSYFSYFLKLENDLQSRFISRCLHFVQYKKITGAAGLKVDNRVKAIVAASAVQLTLGLEAWDLGHFKHIVIHPGDFRHESGLTFSGETNLAGFIKLNWVKFINGYRVGDDGLNLGLHEFAHALRFSGLKEGEDDYFYRNYFIAWTAFAMPVFNDYKAGKGKILRQYGSVNIEEFASVCIEHFFEAPDEILEHYPKLYHATCVLLNQRITGSTVKIHVREQEFRKLSQLLPGYTGHELNARLFRNADIIFLMLAGTVYLHVLRVWNGGELVNTLFLLMLIVMGGVMVSRQRSIQISGHSFVIGKGWKIFKRQSVIQFPVSQLISAATVGTGVRITYYNTSNHHFYSETFYAKKRNVRPVLQEMVNNNVGVRR